MQESDSRESTGTTGAIRQVDTRATGITSGNKSLITGTDSDLQLLHAVNGQLTPTPIFLLADGQHHSFQATTESWNTCMNVRFLLIAL